MALGVLKIFDLPFMEKHFGQNAKLLVTPPQFFWLLDATLANEKVDHKVGCETYLAIVHPKGLCPGDAT